MTNHLQRSQFARISDYMSTWLTYSQLFNRKATKEEIINDIQSIKLSEALIILAKFSVLNEDGTINMMKNLSPFIKNHEFIEATEPMDLINILYSFKWFIAYGNESPLKSFDNGIPNPINVFITVLKIADIMELTIDKIDDASIENQVMKTSLFNRPGEMDRAIIRQHLMFEEIARKKEYFDSYIDIHSFFEKEYGYSVKEYVGTVFALQQLSIKEVSLENILMNHPWGIKTSMYFNNLKTEEVSLKISKELSTDLNSLKKWAKNTLNNPFDYEELITTPLLRINEFLIPFSPGLLNNTIFDGLCFKFNTALRKNHKEFFPFFGKIFEKYVEIVLEAAVEESESIPYEYIKEFGFDKNGNKKSSDSYIKLGKSLLAIECKSGRLLKETKVLAERKIGEKDYKKFVINPIQQANLAYKGILSKMPEKFNRVNQVIILSVSLQSFPKIPSYTEMLDPIKNELHPHIKAVDYIGVSDLELLALVISKYDFSIFKYIKLKKMNDDYIPYLNYYYEKYGEIKRTDYLNYIFENAISNIKETIFD